MNDAKRVDFELAGGLVGNIQKGIFVKSTDDKIGNCEKNSHFYALIFIDQLKISTDKMVFGTG